MATHIDRKRLWGRSGSRCAICNDPLTEVEGVDSIVGDEAHIRSKSPSGPRYDPDYPNEKVDSYENLILLCKVHHKLVDDNEAVFSAVDLEDKKRRHEARVSAALGADVEGWVDEPALAPISNGTQLMGLLHGSRAYMTGHDHPESEEEQAAVGEFLQSVQDWGDISEDIGPGGRVRGAAHLHTLLDGLADLGFLVAAGAGDYRLRTGLVFQTAAVQVLRVIKATGSDRTAPDG